MAHSNARADRQRFPWVYVAQRKVLNIRVGTNCDFVAVGTEHRIEPHRRPMAPGIAHRPAARVERMDSSRTLPERCTNAQYNIANDMRPWSHPRGLGNGRRRLNLVRPRLRSAAVASCWTSSDGVQAHRHDGANVPRGCAGRLRQCEHPHHWQSRLWTATGPEASLREPGWQHCGGSRGDRLQPKHSSALDSHLSVFQKSRMGKPIQGVGSCQARNVDDESTYVCQHTMRTSRTADRTVSARQPGRGGAPNGQARSAGLVELNRG